ncbi:MAG TPA: hypothetical protein DEH10_04295 [Pseudomonas sp.]|nr:hypothetical protein [Pseudomonas sp.]
MNRPSACRPAGLLRVLGVRGRGPPPCGDAWPAAPDYPPQERQDREKAEGKIKGGGTSWRAKAVCTGD